MTKAPAAALPANFEDAMKELETIVRKLEGGQQDLDASINDYVRGTELKSFCEQKLSDARMKVESILKAHDGTITTKNFEEK